MITGTISYRSFEEEFNVIEGDDGTMYDPIGLPDEFKRRGLRVKAIVRTGFFGSFHRYGTIVEILHIERLNAMSGLSLNLGQPQFP